MDRRDERDTHRKGKADRIGRSGFFRIAFQPFCIGAFFASADLDLLDTGDQSINQTTVICISDHLSSQVFLFLYDGVSEEEKLSDVNDQNR